jgi:glyoxylate carboligase
VSPAAAATAESGSDVTEPAVTEFTVTKTGVTAAALRLRQRFRQRKLKPGDAVLARRRSGAGWYTAVVTGIASNGNYAVTYGASASAGGDAATGKTLALVQFLCLLALHSRRQLALLLATSMHYK